jgi:5-methyltetrahydrofolate--homocysteine methyltransferase
MDVVAFQVVTVGRKPPIGLTVFKRPGITVKATLLTGWPSRWRKRQQNICIGTIRRELGLDAEQGKRYSWGYPAIPELADHVKVFSLLPVEQELGMTLTSAFQLVPEQSTAAIVYTTRRQDINNIGESRIEQLMKD